MLSIHLVDYILQGNHAVFEHPIPGVRISMATIIKVDVLPTSIILLGGISCQFDLRQDRLPLDD